MRLPVIIIALALLLPTGCLTKDIWTADEIIQWHAEYAVDDPKDFYSPLYYCGTDEKYHHFIIRVMDDWVIMKVAKEEIDIADPRPLATSSGGASPGYYAIDPQNGFRRIEESDR